MSRRPVPDDVAALSALVPPGLRCMVEIGCGSGALGALLTRRDPACRRIGVEADREAAARAAPHYHALHLLPPDASLPLPNGSADMVVLRGAPQDPSTAIQAASLLLAPDGVLLLDLPNAGHWRIVEALLAGTMQPPCIPGHALTRAGLLEAVRLAGLVPLDLPPLAPEEASRALGFAERLGPALAALGTDPAAFLRSAGPARWLLRAARRRPPPLLLVAHALKPVGGVNAVRIDLPLGALARWPGTMLVSGPQPDLPPAPEEVPRIVVLHRRLLDRPNAHAFVNHLRRQGCVLVQEFDDHPSPWPSIAASGHFAFRGVHAVQTTTPALAALFRGFNPEVAVFPNTVPELPEPTNFTDPGRLTLFLGALRREADTAPFLPMLDEVLAEAEGRLRVEVLSDQRSFEALRSPHKRFRPLLPYADYLAAMARCELAFLPLADTLFNRCKSDLKFIEAGAHGLCCLASPVVYGEVIRDGETGLIVRDPEALRTTLHTLLANPARARMIGAAAQSWARENRMLAGQVAARRAWYNDLWARRAELDAALLARAPELGAAG